MPNESTSHNGKKLRDIVKIQPPLPPHNPQDGERESRWAELSKGRRGGRDLPNGLEQVWRSEEQSLELLSKGVPPDSTEKEKWGRDKLL